jgi:tetratricopeptide (TPR) repeat protein
MKDISRSLSEESSVKEIFYLKFFIPFLLLYLLFIAMICNPLFYYLGIDPQPKLGLNWLYFLVIAVVPLIPLILLFKRRDSILNSAYGYTIFEIFKYIGKLGRWLISGWRPMIIRLIDIAIGFFLIRVTLLFLFNIWNPSPLGINQANVSPGISVLVNGIYLKATPLPGNNGFDWNLLSGLVINSSRDQILIFSNSQNIFNQITYQLITTIWYDWEKMIFLWFLIEVLVFAWNRSQRLVVEEVCNLSNADTSSVNSSSSGKKDSKLPVSQLAGLLILHLDRISERYRVVDEKRSTPSGGGAGKPINAVMNTEGMGDMIQATIGGSGEFAVGPLKIPASSVAALLGGLMRGPKIVLSLCRTRDISENGDTIEAKPFLTASITMENRSHSWLVQTSDPLEKKDSLEQKKRRDIEDMVLELAHKIFATLTNEEENISWKASYKFSEGLREYRDSLFSAEKRFYHLKMAENEFLLALQESPNYALAYYNLGVVYTELEQFEAAESAFIKSIENESEGWQAYYALGVNLYNRTRKSDTIICNIYACKRYSDLENNNYLNEVIAALPETCKQNIITDYEKILLICDHVIFRIRDDESLLTRDNNKLARVYNLQGNTIRQLFRFNHGYSNLEKAITLLKRSVACAWMNLIISELNGWNLDEERHIVSECMIDLADAELCFYKLYNNCMPQDAIDGLISAIKIDPANANLHKYLGEAYFCFKDYKQSAIEFEYATGIKPENPNYWAHAALAKVHSGQMQEAFRALKRVHKFGPGTSAESIRTAIKTCQEIIKSLNNTGSNMDLIKMNEQICRWQRALLMMEVSQYSEIDQFTVFHLGKILNEEVNDINRGKDMDWRYAQMVLSYINICDKMDEKNFAECDELKSAPSLKQAYKQDCVSSCLISIDKFDLAAAINQKATTKDGCIFEPEELREKLTRRAIEGLVALLKSGTEDRNHWKRMQDKFALARLRLSQRKKWHVFSWEAIPGEDEGKLREFLIRKLDIYWARNAEFRRKDKDKTITVSGEICSLVLRLNNKNIEIITELDKNIANKLIAKNENDKLNIYDIGNCLEIKKDLLDIFDSICECMEKNDKYRDYFPEYCQLLIEIGKILLEDEFIEDNEAANGCFKMAMALLEVEQPDEIKRLGLENLLAKSLHNSENDSDALAEARQAQFRDPLDRENAKLIGEIYLNYEDYSQSIPNLGLAFSRESKNPDNPNVLRDMGISKYNKSLNSTDKTSREESLKDAREYFERALIISERYNLSGRGDLRCYLGRINMAMKKYDEAADYFSIVYRVTKKRKGLIAGLNLALAQHKMKNYKDSESTYREIINHLAANYINEDELIIFDENQGHLSKTTSKWQDLIERSSIPDDVTKAKDKESSRGSILASALIGLASSYAKRDTNLGIALNLVGKSDKVVDKLKGQEKEKWMAANADCRGFILFKITEQYLKDRATEAIECLEGSVSLRATPEAYLHLALAYKLKMDRAKSPDIKAQFNDKARKCLKHAQDLDVTEQLSDELTELMQSFESPGMMAAQ